MLRYSRSNRKSLIKANFWQVCRMSLTSLYNCINGLQVFLLPLPVAKWYLTTGQVVEGGWGLVLNFLFFYINRQRYRIFYFPGKVCGPLAHSFLRSLFCFFSRPKEKKSGVFFFISQEKFTLHSLDLEKFPHKKSIKTSCIY